MMAEVRRRLKGAGSALEPWFKWTTAGVFLGFVVQWNQIQAAYFAEDKSTVQEVTGILLAGFGLNFAVIGTVFVQSCGNFLQTRAATACLARNFPKFLALIKPPFKVRNPSSSSTQVHVILRPPTHNSSI
jgi:hypothetical protein